jgi:glutathione synthase/RimK-type ligase-like ATP-grasp enzyme
MKIAIHPAANSFSERWITYCETKGINYKLVNCYSTDILDQISDCDALMWNFHHKSYKDLLFAKQLLLTIELTGKKVFPDSKTCWHFDDKVAQKYLLESIKAPIAPSYVFYSKSDAMNWIKETSFPKVFKLRSGAGSQNVRLVKSLTQARKLVLKAFNRGFSQFDRIGYLKERIRQYRDLNDNLLGVMKGIARLFIPTEFARMHAREKGYILFQDFIPNNNFDIRVIVIDNKAFAIKRMVRKNDFRASGSGDILYEKENFSVDTIRLSFQLTDKLQSRCIAYDFIYNDIGSPFIVEISYSFTIKVYDSCTGYWDRNLNFHEGPFIPQNWMVDSVLNY